MSGESPTELDPENAVKTQSDLFVLSSALEDCHQEFTNGRSINSLLHKNMWIVSTPVDTVMLVISSVQLKLCLIGPKQLSLQRPHPLAPCSETTHSTAFSDQGNLDLMHEKVLSHVHIDSRGLLMCEVSQICPSKHRIRYHESQICHECV
ncbi:hypothetical protein ANN_21500 [Periplaneta americana]|uniref:Uncharacterized protein n=1 Tax=Periplaneta americana TaxID=6978 RepID=A0ABQ8SGN6_PERAM|nr:hypothetical protein ANN_21500 [Periplaneta americana]